MSRRHRELIRRRFIRERFEAWQRGKPVVRDRFGRKPFLEDGHYDLEVEATDLRGNQGRLRQPFTITNEL